MPTVTIATAQVRPAVMAAQWKLRKQLSSGNNRENPLETLHLANQEAMQAMTDSPRVHMPKKTCQNQEWPKPMHSVKPKQITGPRCIERPIYATTGGAICRTKNAV